MPIEDTFEAPPWIKLERRDDVVQVDSSHELVRDEAGVWIETEDSFSPGLSFVSRFEACPRCRSSLISGEICGLCELDVKAALFDQVHELALRPSPEGSALRTILKTIDEARRQGRPLLRIFHGVDKAELPRTLAWHLAERGDLKDWVIGDVVGDRVQVGRDFASDWPIVRWSNDWNAENTAVTWLVIEPLHLRAQRFKLLSSTFRLNC